jgi:hypothetical protein
MVTKLDASLKRALSIEGKPYVVTITPTGFVLTEKGRRKGFEMDWVSFVSGDAALATALTASIAKAPSPRKREPQQQPPSAAATTNKRSPRTRSK